MKIAKFFAGIFAALGAVLMVGAIGLSLMSLDAPARVGKVPEAVTNLSQTLMDAVSGGDFASAGALMYGQPDLGAGQGSTDAVETMLWEAFTDSIQYEFTGACYVTETGFARDASITTLDIATAAGAIAEQARALLTQRVENAQEMEELYDEENNFREELIQEVLLEGARQALQEHGQTVTTQVTLRFLYRDGQWWAVPDQALLKAISGGVA